MTEGPIKKDTQAPPSYSEVVASGQPHPTPAVASSSRAPAPGGQSQYLLVPVVDPRSQTAREAARHRAVMRFLEAFIYKSCDSLPILASAVQHAGLTSASPALVSDEHLINRSLLDHLDAHDAIDFVVPERQRLSSTSSADTLQQPSSQKDSFLVDSGPESNSLLYPTQSLRPQASFAPIQPPAQQHSLRHHPSASNDALRGFGPINPPGPDSNLKQPFPQELYSSSAIPDPSPFSRSGSEYDYPMNGNMNGLGASSQLLPGNRPSPNTFGMGPQPGGAYPLPGGPILPSSLMQPVQKQPPPNQSGLPIMPQHPTNGTQMQNAPLYSSVPPQSLNGPPPPPAVHLAQIIQNLPPQQKAAVMGRLQEMALNPQQSQPQPPPQSQQPPPPPQVLPLQSAQSGAAQEEISTIFVVGFPDDMTEREFQNMFTFCPGYEAATLKVPTKELAPPGPSNPAVAAAASALAGASDPYNLVTMNSGGVVVDQGNNTTATTSSTWASGLDDPYTRQALAAAAATSSSTSELAQQLALAQQAQPRKQIIGFAKFRSKEEALHARDVLHGRRVDIEKGALLKAEMAKKNLHTKRGVGPLQVSLPAGAAGNGPGTAQPGGPPMANESPTPLPGAIGSGKPQGLQPGGPNGLPSQEGVASLSSSFASLNTGASPSEPPNMVPNLPMGSESPTFKLQQRTTEVAPFVPSNGPTLMTGNMGDQPTYYSTPPSSFNRSGMQTLHHQHSLHSLTEGRASDPYHSLPNKPISDVVKANALPPTNLPPPPGSVAGSRRAASSHGGSPPAAPSQQESDTGYISDALSTSHRSERSRAESFSRYGGYTPPPNEEESHVHLPQHLLQEDILGTPQQTDYSSKLIENPDYASTADWSTIRPTRKMTEPPPATFSPVGDISAGFIGSSASSAAGSVRSDGAESISTSTTSGGNGAPAYPPPPELGRQRGRTMPSLGGVLNGGSLSGSEQPGRHSSDHPRRGGNAADQNPPINTLYVGNLPTSLPTPQSAKVLEEGLLQIFSRCPGYSKMVFRQKNNGPMCFVEFDDVSNATKALNELYGNSLNGIVKGGGIRLSYSKNPLGVRTTVPGNPGPAKVTSPIHSPTTHAPYQYGNMPNMPNMPSGIQEPRGVMPMEMPRGGRMRGDTMDMMMGPASPPGRFMPASPPNGQMSAFGAMGKPVSTFGRGPMNMGMQGTQSFVMASSPPAQSPISSAGYQGSTTFQPFGQVLNQSQLDMTRDLGQPGLDPNSGA